MLSYHQNAMGMFAEFVGYTMPIISIKATSALPLLFKCHLLFIWLVFFIEKVDGVA